MIMEKVGRRCQKMCCVFECSAFRCYACRDKWTCGCLLLVAMHAFLRLIVEAFPRGSDGGDVDRMNSGEDGGGDNLHRFTYLQRDWRGMMRPQGCEALHFEVSIFCRRLSKDQ